jgi:hypothetical protein
MDQLDIQQEKKRTNRQNRALHLYFQMVSDTLNEAGLDMKELLPEIDIPWSKSAVKEYLWRPIQKVQIQKSSTTEMTTKDIDIIFDTLNRYLAKYGIHEDFPSIETIMYKLQEKDNGIK